MIINQKFRLKVAMLDNLLNVYSIVVVIIAACIGVGLSFLHRYMNMIFDI